MSFICKKCKKVKIRQTQFKKIHNRKYLTEEGEKAEQIQKEDLICYKCWKKGKKK